MQRKGLKDILLLGDPRLYENCEPVLESELELVPLWVADLAQAMQEIREQYQFGRGIAAPQLGIMKRLIYIDLGQPRIILNPEMYDLSPEMFEIWDDCMSFPNLLVRVERHQSLTLKYRDENWHRQEWKAEGAESELIQHEVDHLNGVLCTMRALDDKSFRWVGR
ncbi:MAG: peptide deformylase [Bacteroidia bacterium]|nr:peptide deformylase [Bacteroidia bacterium]